MSRFSIIKSKFRGYSLLWNSEFWISIFIVAYLFIAAVILSSNGKDKVGPVITAIRTFSETCGLNQNWALFSPNIRRCNLHNIVIINFKDGAVKLYEWPRLDRADLLDQTRNDKYRKMFIDCMPWPKYSVFHPSLARFMAKANLNPKNQPEFISLAYFWCDIPPPEKWVPQQQLPETSKFYCYFTYKVQPEDLL